MLPWMLSRQPFSQGELDARLFSSDAFAPFCLSQVDDFAWLAFFGPLSLGGQLAYGLDFSCAPRPCFLLRSPGPAFSPLSSQAPSAWLWAGSLDQMDQTFAKLGQILQSPILCQTLRALDKGSADPLLQAYCARLDAQQLGLIHWPVFESRPGFLVKIERILSRMNLLPEQRVFFDAWSPLEPYAGKRVALAFGWRA